MGLTVNSMTHPKKIRLGGFFFGWGKLCFRKDSISSKVGRSKGPKAVRKWVMHSQI